MLFQNYLDGVIIFQLKETEKNISKVIYMNVWARKIFDSFSELGDKMNQLQTNVVYCCYVVFVRV